MFFLVFVFGAFILSCIASLIVMAINVFYNEK